MRRLKSYDPMTYTMDASRVSEASELSYVLAFLEKAGARSSSAFIYSLKKNPRSPGILMILKIPKEKPMIIAFHAVGSSAATFARPSIDSPLIITKLKNSIKDLLVSKVSNNSRTSNLPKASRSSKALSRTFLRLPNALSLTNASMICQ